MANAAQPKSGAALRDTTEFDSDSQGPTVIPIRASEDADPLGHFLPEEESEASVPATGGDAESHVSRRLRASRKTLAVAGASAAVALLVGAPAWYVREHSKAPPPVKPTPAVGRVALNSRPEGATVFIDGRVRGVTPLELELAAGSHDVVFRTAGGDRPLALAVESGARVIEDVDVPVAAETTAQIDITSDPVPARVTVDGRLAGQTPLKQDMPAGRHVIVVSRGTATVTRTVDAVAGRTSSIFVSLAPGSPATTGTFAVESPVELRVIENGRLLGVSNAAPVAMSVGRHQIDLDNDALELHVTRTVTIDPGKSTNIDVPVPNGVIFINASPWADVFIDGRNVGVTPLGNVAVVVGTHDIVFRHPQFGDRHRSVVVGARTPIRVAADLTR